MVADQPLNPGLGVQRPEEELYSAVQDEVAAIARRSRRVHRDQARALHPDLDPTALPVLLVLARQEPLRMSELAEALWLDKSTATRQVNAVARLGLVERLPDPTDARARLVRLTGEGRSRVTAVFAEQRQMWTTALSGWSATDLRELTRLLRQLRESDIV
jgi:DNA-binding MarR family transcriptional regulator